MGDVVGVNPDGLHKVGRTTSGRDGSAKSSASALQLGIDTAGQGLGAGRLKSAARRFVDNHVTDHARALPVQIDGAGISTSNTASVARASDEDGAAAVTRKANSQNTLQRDINAPRPE